MEQKIEYIKKAFLNKGYQLNAKDLEDLNMQIKRKPPIIYIKSIEFLQESSIEITYNNVKNFIKKNIKIRDLVKSVVSGIEESFRTSLIKYDATYDEYVSIKNKNFGSLIKNSKHPETEILLQIKNIRNNVSHLSYPIIEDNLTNIIETLLKSKEIDFIEDNRIDNIVEEIKKIMKAKLK